MSGFIGDGNRFWSSLAISNTTRWRETSSWTPFETKSPRHSGKSKRSTKNGNSLKSPFNRENLWEQMRLALRFSQIAGQMSNSTICQPIYIFSPNTSRRSQHWILLKAKVAGFVRLASRLAAEIRTTQLNFGFGLVDFRPVLASEPVHAKAHSGHALASLVIAVGATLRLIHGLEMEPGLRALAIHLATTTRSGGQIDKRFDGISQWIGAKFEQGVFRVNLHFGVKTVRWARWQAERMDVSAALWRVLGSKCSNMTQFGLARTEVIVRQNWRWSIDVAAFDKRGRLKWCHSIYRKLKNPRDQKINALVTWRKEDSFASDCNTIRQCNSSYMNWPSQLRRRFCYRSQNIS